MYIPEKKNWRKNFLDLFSCQFFLIFCKIKDCSISEVYGDAGIIDKNKKYQDANLATINKLVGKCCLAYKVINHSDNFDIAVKEVNPQPFLPSKYNTIFMFSNSFFFLRSFIGWLLYNSLCGCKILCFDYKISKFIICSFILLLVLNWWLQINIHV